jgi:hypothetical protein
VQRWLVGLLFLSLTLENSAEHAFGDKWHTPWADIGELLFHPLLKVPPIALIIVLMLVKLRGQAASRRGRTPLLDKALWLNVFAMGWLFVWGMLRGGSLQSALWQAHVFAFVPIVAFLFSAGLRSELDFRAAGKAIVYAALYRALVGMYFYFKVAPALGYEVTTMTTHADTVLFTTAFLILASVAIEERSQAAVRRLVGFGALLLLAIQLNNRRLAYVDIGAALATLYVLLPKDAFKRRVRRWLLIAAPFAALYLAAGWTSQSAFFKPARSVASMFGGKQQDASSQTRDIENYNLVVTLKQQPILGSGWGHEYLEVSSAYSISEIFPLYRFIPHNSVLGIWAFTGVVGSTGLWLMFVVAAYCAARAYRRAQTPLIRSICAVSISEIMIYGLQGYGDMGIVAWTATMLMGLGLAAASRMAATTGVFAVNAPAPAAPPPPGPTRA